MTEWWEIETRNEDRPAWYRHSAAGSPFQSEADGLDALAEWRQYFADEEFRLVKLTHEVVAATPAPAGGAEVAHEWIPCPRHMIPTDCGTCCEKDYLDPVHQREARSLVRGRGGEVGCPSCGTRWWIPEAGTGEMFCMKCEDVNPQRAGQLGQDEGGERG